MRAQWALTATYTVVDDLKAALQAAQEENGLLLHRIDCLQQALDEAVAARKAAEANVEYYHNEWLHGCTFALRKRRL